jgi:hypothetical protein
VVLLDIGHRGHAALLSVDRNVGGMTVLEVKRHLNKPDASYGCDLLVRGPGYVVLKYVSDRPGRVGDVPIEVGCTTFAYYRDGAGYVLWKMCGADGRLKGHLFHICRDLKVGDGRVEYLDLLLDLWYDATGRLTVLDRDELEACRISGVVGEADLEWIGQQEQRIVRHVGQMLGELDARLGTGG